WLGGRVGGVRGGGVVFSGGPPFGRGQLGGRGVQGHPGLPRPQVIGEGDRQHQQPGGQQQDSHGALPPRNSRDNDPSMILPARPTAQREVTIVTQRRTVTRAGSKAAQIRKRYTTRRVWGRSGANAKV